MNWQLREQVDFVLDWTATLLKKGDQLLGKFRCFAWFQKLVEDLWVMSDWWADKFVELTTGRLVRPDWFDQLLIVKVESRGSSQDSSQNAEHWAFEPWTLIKLNHIFNI